MPGLLQDFDQVPQASPSAAASSSSSSSSSAVHRGQQKPEAFGHASTGDSAGREGEGAGAGGSDSVLDESVTSSSSDSSMHGPHSAEAMYSTSGAEKVALRQVTLNPAPSLHLALFLFLSLSVSLMYVQLHLPSLGFLAFSSYAVSQRVCRLVAEGLLERSEQSDTHASSSSSSSSSGHGDGDGDDSAAASRLLSLLELLQHVCTPPALAETDPSPDLGGGLTLFRYALALS